MVSDDYHDHHGGVGQLPCDPPVPMPLKPRSLLVRAKLVPTGMKVLQRNINFGRVASGSEVTRSLTVVNLTATRLLFGVSKSGSIASGFLEMLAAGGIPGSRHGMVEGNSSRVLQFAFKPALPGSLEETISIYNICDPSNMEHVTIKADVYKPQKFKIILPPKHSSDKNEDGSVQDKDSVRRALSASLPPDSGLHVDNVPFLGICELGDSSSLNLTFKLRNITVAPRRLIVDASHGSAIKMLTTPTLDKPLDSSDHLFENLPSDVLSSVCVLHCNFSITEHTKPEVSSKV
jgi:hypothetical protein